MDIVKDDKICYHVIILDIAVTIDNSYITPMDIA